MCFRRLLCPDIKCPDNVLLLALDFLGEEEWELMPFLAIHDKTLCPRAREYYQRNEMLYFISFRDRNRISYLEPIDETIMIQFPRGRSILKFDIVAGKRKLSRQALFYIALHKIHDFDKILTENERQIINDIRTND